MNDLEKELNTWSSVDQALLDHLCDDCDRDPAKCYLEHKCVLLDE